MNDAIKKLDSSGVDKKLGRILMWIIIGLTFFAIVITYIIRAATLQVKNGSVASENLTTPITSTEWVQIPTRGKTLHLTILPTNGMKLRYTVVIDGNMSNKFVCPGTNIPSHLYYGITNFWVKLNTGQVHSVGYLLCEWTEK